MATQEIVRCGFSFNTHEQSGFVFKTVPKLSSSKMKVGLGGGGVKNFGKKSIGEGQKFLILQGVGLWGCQFFQGEGRSKNLCRK